MIVLLDELKLGTHNNNNYLKRNKAENVNIQSASFSELQWSWSYCKSPDNHNTL